MRQKRSSNTKVAAKPKKRTLPPLTTNSKIGPNFLILEIPLRTVSEANCTAHWRVKHKRHKAQQAVVSSSLNPLKNVIRLPCKIIFTRLAPDKFDKHDNLPMSFKYIVDIACAIITNNFIPGQADNDDRIEIAYDQVYSKSYGIKLEFLF